MSEVIESKQDKVVAMVQAGVYTRKQILDEVGCTAGALASYFSGMRSAARYSGAKLFPIEVLNNGNKIFQAATYADAQAMLKATDGGSKRSPASAKPWSVRMEMAKKRVAKATRAVEVTKARADKSNTMIDSLYAKVAQAEFELANYLLADLASNEVEDDTLDPPSTLDTLEDDTLDPPDMSDMSDMSDTLNVDSEDELI